MRTLKATSKTLGTHTIKYSDQDHALVSKYNWGLQKIKGVIYARTMVPNHVHRNRISLRMHRLIMRFPNCKVDHRNRNGLDNRRCNLRLATNSQNSMNARTRRSSKTGYKGVHWAKRDERYVARIVLNYKPIGLGYFTNVIDAAKAYNAAAKKYFGEYARLNIIP